MRVSPSLALLLCIALPIGPNASSVGTQPPTYGGMGFQDVVATGVTPIAVELAETTGDGLPDALFLFSNGTLLLNPRTLEAGHGATLGGGTTYTHVATSRSGGDAFWTTDGTNVAKVDYDEVTGLASTAVQSGLALSGASVFRIVERAGVSHLLVVDNAQTRVRVFQLAAGTWTQIASQNASGPQGSYHDVMVYDHDGQGADELAVVTNRGLELWSLTNQPIQLFEHAPADAFLELLPAASTQWNRDHLVWHRLVSGSGELRILNSGHDETVSLVGSGVHQVRFGGFSNLSGTLPDLMYSDSDQHRMTVVPHATTTSLAAGLFQAGPTSRMTVDLDPQNNTSGGGPAVAPLLACLDLDLDGDDDVLVVDDAGETDYLLSSMVDEEATRVDASLGSIPARLQAVGDATHFQMELHVENTVSADSVRWELYYQPEGGTVQRLPLATGTVADDSVIYVNVPLPSSNPKAALHFVVRGFDAATDELFPPLIFAWSDDDEILNAFINPITNLFPWVEDPFSVLFATSNGDSGGIGGTVRRPKTTPGTILP